MNTVYCHCRPLGAAVNLKQSLEWNLFIIFSQVRQIQLLYSLSLVCLVWFIADGALRSFSTAPVLLNTAASSSAGKDVVLVDGVRTPFLMSGTE